MNVVTLSDLCIPTDFSLNAFRPAVIRKSNSDWDEVVYFFDDTRVDACEVALERCPAVAPTCLLEEAQRPISRSIVCQSSVTLGARRFNYSTSSVLPAMVAKDGIKSPPSNPTKS